MQSFSFKTVQSESEGFFKDKGSKFLSFVYPVESEEEVKQKLDALRKKYFDARHHCYAYMLGETERRFRANDDGEPNHSAGDPILGQIRSKGITNVLIVVVRYFGGVKLGVGGLIAAYKTAAESALASAKIIENEIRQKIRITYSYSSTPEVMRLVKDFELNIITQTFEEECVLKGSFKVKIEDELTKQLHLLKSLGSNLSFEFQ
jgi:uncharacterized YigZ family protein